MGLGDNLMATGLARGAAGRGRRVAFGDKTRIIWDQHSEIIFRRNPNVAKPGSERDPDLQWIAFHKGHRIYNRQDGRRWIWNMEFKAVPGEVFFNPSEIRNGARFGGGFVLMEPDVPTWKSVAPNKDWGRKNYQAVADKLKAEGLRVVQFRYPKSGAPLTGVDQLKTLDFRDSLAILKNAALYVGPEGGLHHGAAAVGRPAVVLFGGFIPPSVTGYQTHTNLTGGAEACGALHPCGHCRDAMRKISVEEVLGATMERLNGR